MTRPCEGHARGASPGAPPAFEGVLVQAHTGSLTLGEGRGRSPPAPGALLRVLPKRAGTCLGRTQPPVEVRLIAAPPQDLRQRVRDGLGRVDVCHCLDGRPIPGPLWRERPTALPLLVAHGLAPDTQALGWRVPGRITAAPEARRRDAWPGKCTLARPS